MGSIFHPEFVQNPKAPFFAPVRKMLASIKCLIILFFTAYLFVFIDAEINSSTMLRERAEKNPQHKEILLQKAELQEKKHLQVIDKNEFGKIIGHLDNVLDKIEEELSKHGEGE